MFLSQSHLFERKGELSDCALGFAIFLATTKADTSSEYSNNKTHGPQGLVYTEIASGFKIGPGVLNFKRIHL